MTSRAPRGMVRPMATGPEIAEARARIGMSQQALAAAVGLSQPAIQKIENGETKRSKFMAEIEQVLGIGGAGPMSSTRLAPVRGLVAAGAWLEDDALAQEGSEPIPYVPMKFTTLEQFAFQIRGDSVDLARLHDGDYAICVAYWQARTEPTDKDLVVIERRRAGTIERTCKVLRVTKEGYELWPKSSNPKWQAPIVVKRDHMGDADTEIEIIALVIGRYSPL